jgi:transcriptional regulator with XRE-family HTH domain
MSATNELLQAPPLAVGQALRRLGQSLRTARLRRNITIQEVAQRIGTGVRAVMEAEKGKASTGIGIYVALLWVYELLSPLNEIANPTRDERGMMLAAAKASTRARKSAPIRAEQKRER